METLFFIILIILGFLVLYFLISQKINRLNHKQSTDKDQQVVFSLMSDLRKEIQDFSGKSRSEIQNRLDKMDEMLDRGITRSSKVIEDQFRESRNLIKETSNKISRFEETNRKIAGFAGQLQSLENILKSPKQRGIVGEYFLETMLKNVFQPNQYKLQYKFQNGDIVDAVIYYNNKILPIDSKFSMESYNRMIEEKDSQRKKAYKKELVAGIKKRIDETSKYIRQKEDTFDFAFMFIPSEAVYYDMLSAQIGALKETSFDLIEYAYKKNVIPVSPTSFYAYLQTVLHGLSAIRMKESIDVFKKNIEKLDRHLKNYEVHFNKVGNHLSTTVNAYNNSSKEFAKIDKDVYRITEGKSGGKGEFEEIEKPSN
ncbi:MAG: DNA recombination protein RmuC [Candidatus Moranbacteria bacterium]|nr:DNA recombination protein RmuC [Candidatus Moranbacteria bacterium]